MTESGNCYILNYKCCINFFSGAAAVLDSNYTTTAVFFKMKTVLILIITIAAVNCGLLKELIQPVTDSVHKGELFNQKEQKEDAKEKKGVLDKLVNNLDAGAEKLISTLTDGFNAEGFDALNKNLDKTKDNSTKADEKPDGTKVEDVKDAEKVEEKKEPLVKDLDDKVSTTVPSAEKDEVKIDGVTTPTTVENDKEVKIDDITTPKIDDIKPEEEKTTFKDTKIEETKA